MWTAKVKVRELPLTASNHNTASNSERNERCVLSGNAHSNGSLGITRYIKGRDRYVGEVCGETESSKLEATSEFLQIAVQLEGDSSWYASGSSTPAGDGDWRHRQAQLAGTCKHLAGLLLNAILHLLGGLALCYICDILS